MRWPVAVILLLSASAAPLAALAQSSLDVGRLVNPWVGQAAPAEQTATPVAGPAADARIAGLWGLATDAGGGTLYAFVGSSRIWKIDAATGAVTAWVGSGAIGNADGSAASATLKDLYDLQLNAADGCLVALAPTKVRRVGLATGDVTTLVGAPSGSDAVGMAEGTGTAARFNWINTITRYEASGDWYTVENVGKRMWRLTPDAAGNPRTSVFVAGDRSQVSPPNSYMQDGTGDAARLNNPGGVRVRQQTGLVYFLEVFGHQVREATAGGVVTTRVNDIMYPGWQAITRDGQYSFVATYSATPTANKVYRVAFETLTFNTVVNTNGAAGISAASASYEGQVDTLNGVALSPDGARLYISQRYTAVAMLELDETPAPAPTCVSRYVFRQVPTTCSTSSSPPFSGYNCENLYDTVPTHEDVGTAYPEGTQREYSHDQAYGRVATLYLTYSPAVSFNAFCYQNRHIRWDRTDLLELFVTSEGSDGQRLIASVTIDDSTSNLLCYDLSAMERSVTGITARFRANTQHDGVHQYWAGGATFFLAYSACPTPAAPPAPLPPATPESRPQCYAPYSFAPVPVACTPSSVPPFLDFRCAFLYDTVPTNADVDTAYAVGLRNEFSHNQVNGRIAAVTLQYEPAVSFNAFCYQNREIPWDRSDQVELTVGAGTASESTTTVQIDDTKTTLMCYDLPSSHSMVTHVTVRFRANLMSEANNQNWAGGSTFFFATNPCNGAAPLPPGPPPPVPSPQAPGSDPRPPSAVAPAQRQSDDDSEEVSIEIIVIAALGCAVVVLLAIVLGCFCARRKAGDADAVPITASVPAALVMPADATTVGPAPMQEAHGQPVMGAVVCDSSPSAKPVQPPVYGVNAAHYGQPVQPVVFSAGTRADEEVHADVEAIP